MQETVFIGEHLWIGNIGTIALLTAFVCALFSSYFAFVAVQQKKPSTQNTYKKIHKIFFLIHTISLLIAFSLLITIILNHYFEYKYVWQHSSTELPFKYLLASIWEGQEGSFLLWAIWHGLLGSLLIWKKPPYYLHVLFFVSICQTLICSMLLGVYIGDIKIGSNPFILMRDVFIDAPIFSQANYLTLIKDGNGLNELLQNYWMVIHPPILFLGYALSIFPMGFVGAALWSGDKKPNLMAAQNWGLWATGILGLGIMMGGAWAYESLSFGGYWAWDPVENASLAPWLVLLAAIHSNIISLKKNKNYHTTYLLFIISFGLVLYSSYLTRSGILGDTSVHAFTDLDMGTQLFLFLTLSLLPPMGLLILKWKNANTPSIPEDKFSSREFWMNTGLLILFFSSIYIILATSLPVFNKIFDTQLTVGKNILFSYNRVMIWSALIVLMLSSLAYFLKFNKTNLSKLRKKIQFPLLAYFLLSTLFAYWVGINYTQNGKPFQYVIYVTLVIACMAICLQLHYLIFISHKRKGALISHIGFALMIVGILLSSSNKEVLSYNYSGFIQNFGDNSAENPLENVTLIKNIPIQMVDYQVTYLGDSLVEEDSRNFFIIEFKNLKNEATFRLYPNAFVNPKGEEGLIANPDKKHYLLEDIFTYVTSIPNPSTIEQPIKKTVHIRSQDTTFLSLGFFLLTVNNNAVHINGFDKYLASFDTTINNINKLQNENIKLPFLKATIKLSSKLTNNTSTPVKIDIEDNGNLSYVTLKVYKFPYINLLWLGVILLTSGTILTFFEKKYTPQKKKNEKN